MSMFVSNSLLEVDMLNRTRNFFPLLPPFMDSKGSHPKAKDGTYGPCVFIVKCLFLGTRWDDGGFPLDCIFDPGLERAIVRFQRENSLLPDGCFGQETRKTLLKIIHVNIDSIPHSVLNTVDLALQPTGEMLQWPPSSLVIPNDGRLLLGDYYRLLPPYIDHPSAHPCGTVGQSMGVSLFILKCLFSGTEYSRKGYPLDINFCSGLYACLRNFQISRNIGVDGCFGQETRKSFAQTFGRDLEQVSRKVLREPSRALQPDGRLIAWPPEITLARS